MLIFFQKWQHRRADQINREAEKRKCKSFDHLPLTKEGRFLKSTFFSKLTVQAGFQTASRGGGEEEY